MKKKIVFTLAVCVLIAGYILLDYFEYEKRDKCTEGVREKYDVLNASEVKIDEKSEEYLFDVKSFMEGSSNHKDAVVSLMRDVALDAEMEGDCIYVSTRPVYFWNADWNKVDKFRCLLVFFDESGDAAGCCEIMLNSKRQVVDEDYPADDFLGVMKSGKRSELICVTAMNKDGVEREDFILDSQNMVVTPLTGYYSFPVTVEGDYFGKIKGNKELVFSYEKLKENLVKIKQ